MSSGTFRYLQSGVSVDHILELHRRTRRILGKAALIPATNIDILKTRWKFESLDARAFVTCSDRAQSIAGFFLVQIPKKTLDYSFENPGLNHTMSQVREPKESVNASNHQS